MRPSLRLRSDGRTTDNQRAAGPPDMKPVYGRKSGCRCSFPYSLNGQFIDRKPLFYKTAIRLFAAIHGQSRTPRDFDPNWRLQTWEKRRRRSFPRTRIHFLCYTRCLRDDPATRQRSDWAQIFQTCAHRLREGQSRACLGQAAFIYSAAPQYPEVRIVACIEPIRRLAPQSKLSVPRW